MVQEFCYRRIQVYCKMKCSPIFSYKWIIQSQSAMGGRKVITGNSSCMPPVTAKKKENEKKIRKWKGKKKAYVNQVIKYNKVTTYEF